MKNITLFAKSLSVTALFAFSGLASAQTTHVLSFSVTQPPELLGDAGVSGDTVCIGDSVMIGGAPTASGGTAPYSYMWTPPFGLSDATIANPIWTIPGPAGPGGFAVIVTDSRNCSVVENVSFVIDSCLVGITEVEGVGMFSVSPNPNNGNFRVEASLDKPVKNFRLFVTTVNGQVVYEVQKQNPASFIQEPVNLTNRAKGIYILRLEFDGKTAEKRIIVQ